MLDKNVNLEGKTVLVTGAAGFIGSNLVKRLFRDVKGVRVVGVDSITDYYDVNIKYERLKEIAEVASIFEAPEKVGVAEVASIFEAPEKVGVAEVASV